MMRSTSVEVVDVGTLLARVGKRRVEGTALSAVDHHEPAPRAPEGRGIHVAAAVEALGGEVGGAKRGVGRMHWRAYPVIQPPPNAAAASAELTTGTTSNSTRSAHAAIHRSSSAGSSHSITCQHRSPVALTQLVT